MLCGASSVTAVPVRVRAVAAARDVPWRIHATRKSGRKKAISEELTMALRIRPYKRCDADTIISWIKDEKIFRYWCADRFDSYPITGADLNAQYDGLAMNDDIFHFVAYDEAGIVGHFNIRFPDRSDIDTVRLGYVIVDDSRRGQGLGKKMIRMALDYAFGFMGAKKVTIGVFEQNKAALGCYLAAGFKDTGITEDYEIFGQVWKCLELAADN